MGATILCGFLAAFPARSQSTGPTYKATVGSGGYGAYQYSAVFYGENPVCASGSVAADFLFTPTNLDGSPYIAGGPGDDGYGPNGTAIASTVNPRKQAGRWVSGSRAISDASSTGAFSGLPLSTFSLSTSWTTSGILQGTYLGGGMYEDGTYTYTEEVKLDLNTGGWTSNVVVSEIATPGSDSCSGTFTTVTTGVYPITLEEITTTAQLRIVNPFAPYIQDKTNYTSLPPAPPLPVSLASVNTAPGASSLAADGLSAVVLVYTGTPQDDPEDDPQDQGDVTFALSATGTGSPLGALAPFDPNYLTSPSPVGPSAGNQALDVPVNTGQCDSTGTCTFLALLWGPSTMPPDLLPYNTLTVTATQSGADSNPQASVDIVPPPVVLVHGIWSSAADAWVNSGFRRYLQSNYPHAQFYLADYAVSSALAFDSATTQGILHSAIDDALAGAASQGMAARSVDVVGHSMGGLVTRYFLSNLSPESVPELPSSPVHKLITIGTPHLGSNLAERLVSNPTQPLQVADIVMQTLCTGLPACTLGNVFAQRLHKPFDNKVNTGAQSLAPNSPQLQLLSPTNVFSAIVGQAPDSITVLSTEWDLNWVIGDFLPGQTVASILNSPPDTNDTIVAATSQDPVGAANIADTATICNIVHTALPGSGDTGETGSQAVWDQVDSWLLGGTGQAPGTGCAAAASSSATASLGVNAATAPSPFLDLTGYTQIPSSNVTFSPASGSALTTNSANNITATSSKTLSEVVLVQTVTDPADALFLYVTETPFTIAFTPTRLGTASFTAFAVFSDKTFATVTLSYALQPSGTPTALALVNAPQANMVAGDSRVIRANAVYLSGNIDVTDVASYTAQSGGSAVFSVGAGGTITAKGNGVDALNVSYNGVSASVPIFVGTCGFALGDVNQIVPYTGGTVSLPVTAASGCAWAATGGSTWLTFSNAQGSGNGTITLTAAANTTGGTQVATVTLGSLSAAITQPATACTYGLSATQINAPGAGQNGNITVTTSCPLVVSSDSVWLIPYNLGTSVDYQVAANPGAARTGRLTIGTKSVSVTQAAAAIVSIASSHAGSFAQGQNGAMYTVTVSNQAGAVPTSGLVTVTETVTSGLTLVAMAGTGWTCPSGGSTCTRNDALAAGSSYPAITVTVNVAANASSPQVNAVSVSGGGSAEASANDSTTIVAAVTGTVSAGSMGQVAAGGLWNTTITLVNTGAAAVPLTLNFYDDNGDALPLPLVFPQTSSAVPIVASTLNETIGAGAELVIQTAGTSSQATVEGWAQLLTNGSIGGSAIFAFTTATGTQEAVVPIETRNPAAFLLPFNYTGGYATGVALANLSNQPVSVPVVLRDATGASLGAAAPVQLAAYAHTSFMLAANYASVAGKYGSVELDTPAGGQIGVLGIRAAPDGAITTIPALATGAVSNGSMAQLAAGGLWNSAITLVNTGSTAAQVSLNFYDDNGNALPLPLIYPLTGSTTPVPTSTLTQTIGAEAQLVIATAGTASQATTEGWAQLTATGGNVGGSAVFGFTTAAGLQEAVSPVETRNPSAFVLPFDYTAGYSTGIALANLSSQTVSVPVILRDSTGTSLGAAAAISLPAYAHTSFMLAGSYPAVSGKLGTLELDTPAGGQISALGIRAAPDGAITTVPVVAK
jgi:pimeloyl-ACP methyl ester carboxylesterase